MDRMSRREMLVASAAAGGGLLLALHLVAPRRVLAAAAKGTPSAFAPNAFIRIGRDGRVTMIVAQVEMGQGTYTSMPMLLAEELEVGLDQVQVEHAPRAPQHCAPSGVTRRRAQWMSVSPRHGTSN